jgi:hypothetical protein
LAGGKVTAHEAPYVGERMPHLTEFPYVSRTSGDAKVSAGSGGIFSGQSRPHQGGSTAQTTPPFCQSPRAYLSACGMPDGPCVLSCACGPARFDEIRTHLGLLYDASARSSSNSLGCVNPLQPSQTHIACCVEVHS